MKRIIIAIIVCISTNVFSLEITVPLKYVNNLSKTYSVPIVGSSMITIDREQIKRYDFKNIQSIIALENNIKNRSLYGNNTSGSKITLDIRGSGAQAKSNSIILVNGQRLNNIDMSDIDLSAIPINSIDRIEIHKGNSGSVLYGEGALGGVINIITDTPMTIEKNLTDKANISLGSFNSKKATYSFHSQQDKFLLKNNIELFESDGYRDENQQRYTNINSRLLLEESKNNVFLDFNYHEQLMSTPSDRSQNQLYDDRRGSDTPDDYINNYGGSFMYGSDYKLNENNQLFINASYRFKDTYSDLQSTSYPSYNETYLKNYQVTPRLINNINIKNNNLKNVLGLDIQYSDYYSKRKKNESSIPLHRYDAWQSTISIYNNSSLNITSKLNLGIGFRYQNNKIAISDSLNKSAPDYAGWQIEHDTLQNEKDFYFSNLGLEYVLNKKVKIFGRTGKGHRFPNIDDRIGGSGGASLDLKNQNMIDYEIGTNIENDISKTSLTFYNTYAKNELAYDTDAFQNMNINSTKRFGVEIENSYKINKKISLTNNLNFTKAKYTSGDQGTYATDFNDNDIPLVPQYSANSRIDFNLNKKTSFSTILQYQDDMRMESDDENFQDIKIPSYFLFDFNLRHKNKNLTTSITINNLLNTKYYNYAVASSNTQGAYNAYPQPEREILFSLEYSF